MQEKIVEILIYLMGELRNDVPLGEIDLSVLTNRGYTPAEISTAFNWLYEKISRGENLVTDVSESSPHSHRVLHEAERVVFTPEAHGYLVQLREIGLLRDADLEAIIDRVMLSGYAVAEIAEIRSLVAAQLLSSNDSQNPGSRIMLNNQDTIH